MIFQIIEGWNAYLSHDSQKLIEQMLEINNSIDANRRIRVEVYCDHQGYTIH